jgi:sterol desaturase/sphingolipid hydroxylase (fatty acid hydroxylase superfamily)
MRIPANQVRLFKSDFLEQFTRVHPMVPFVLWVPIIVGLYFFSFRDTALSSMSIFAWSLIGLFSWTLAEYLLHRFAFHFPAESPLGKRFVYLMHGLHHNDPNDPTRLLMPPLPALIYSAALFGFFRLLLGPDAILPFFGAFLIGYLIYDYIHYYVHHFKPTNEWGKYLKKYHMVHHFQDHDAKWGVSSPFWDFVFGTMNLKSSKSKSAFKR